MRRSPPKGGARLACVKRAASVRPEPGSNSQLHSWHRSGPQTSFPNRKTPRPAEPALPPRPRARRHRVAADAANPTAHRRPPRGTQLRCLPKRCTNGPNAARTSPRYATMRKNMDLTNAPGRLVPRVRLAPCSGKGRFEEKRFYLEPPPLSRPFLRATVVVGDGRLSSRPDSMPQPPFSRVSSLQSK